MRARRICHAPRCSNLQPCAVHVRRPWAGQRPNFRERYGGAWDSVRAQVLDEEPACRECGSAGEPRVDHMVPLSEGGNDERSNLQRLCRSCSDRKTAAEAARGRRRANAR